MGRIKSTLIKRTSKQLLIEKPESFNIDIEKNKKALKEAIPSKRMRNSIAGYISRLKKQQKEC